MLMIKVLKQVSFSFHIIKMLIIYILTNVNVNLVKICNYILKYKFVINKMFRF